MTTPEKKLFLLDAYALIYRAHFAFSKSPRINSKGVNTSVPFGFTNTLLEILQKQKPSHIAVAFDTSAKTFRDEIFTEYKATRQETPEDIRAGIPSVKNIIRGFNIPILELDGYEADDIIGTISNQAASKGFVVYMMTPDKDFGQLVKKNVFLYKPAYLGNAVDVMGEKEVCEKWDIENVSQVIDMLGLQGDTSDNIPGIPGIGPKTAAVLLKQFGSVEGVIANSAQLKGKQKESVEKYGEQALLSKKLATIITDVPVAFDEESLLYKGPNETILKPIFDEFEFKTIASRVFSSGVASSPTAVPTRKEPQLSMFESSPGKSAVGDSKPAEGTSYTEVTTADDRAKLAASFKEQKIISLECITDGPSNFDSHVNGLALSCAANEASFIPTQNNEEAKQFIKDVAEILEDDRVTKVGHNIKASVIALRKIGVTVRGPVFDTMIAHYLIEPEAAHDLPILCSQFLGFEMLADTDSKKKNQVCERVDKIYQLKSKLEQELGQRSQKNLMTDLEMPLLKVLAAMEFEGVKIDTASLAKMSEVLRTESEKVQKEVYKDAGVEFNIGSPKQLGEVLFDKMKLIDKPKKTKSGQYATGEDILLSLASKHVIVKKILDYREYEKLRSTYVDALPKMISPDDGRIHTDYRQAVAATGRLSSYNPNLQNIPIRTEKGREIRKAFVVRDKDYMLMSADYSQIELRIAASFAKDETMIEAFRSKRDIHTTTAAKVFKVSLDKVTPDMRRKAKEVNFGILYGSSAFGLSQNLGIPRTEAAEIIQSYFTEFNAIKQYMDNSIEKAREKEYVETILGRRRYLRDINSRNAATRAFAERNAINAPIQGSAADIIKIAMINIHDWMQEKKLKSRMTMQVHDELVFDVHKDEVDIMKDQVARLMRSAIKLEVPMEVEVGVGTNWLEAH